MEVGIRSIDYDWSRGVQDLMSKVIKDLPSDPIDFLVRKLQSLQRLRKKVCLLFHSFHLNDVPVFRILPTPQLSALSKHRGDGYKSLGHQSPRKLQQRNVRDWQGHI